VKEITIDEIDFLTIQKIPQFRKYEKKNEELFQKNIKNEEEIILLMKDIKEIRNNCKLIINKKSQRANKTIRKQQ
jgi:hypothetical protein